jgi:adenylate kinase family enzyme
MDTYTFVFFGIVGSGKGTQVKLLMDFLSKKDGKGCVYAYPGAEFRKLIESGEYTGNLVKDSVNRGELQPDFLTSTIFTNLLTASLTADKHLIADGYPRTIVQSKDFESMMKFYKRKIVKIIYIEVGEHESMKRNLLRGRADDTKEGIARRFDEYMDNVIPAMEYFKEKDGYEFYKVDGEQSVESVHKDIIKALKF